MSDLVETYLFRPLAQDLRDEPTLNYQEAANVLEQAADRIEALEKALREIYDMDAPKRGFPPDTDRVEGPFARLARAALNRGNR